jgi:hypothetical protein
VMALSREQCDLLGGVVAIAAFVLADAVFIARLMRSPGAEQVVGALFLLLFVPVLYLGISAFHLARPGIYVVWIALFMLFLAAELLLDYVFKTPFREVRWQVILYVTLFFGSLGGMIGVARQAGRAWAVAAIIGFLSTVVLAFVQRQVTGQ